MPKPTWWRYSGHLDDAEETLYSFTQANLDQKLVFGIDTTTEEGRARFKAEFDAFAEIAPEILKKDDLIFPHEMPSEVPQEPHYLRVWAYYREYNLRRAIDAAVQQGHIKQADSDACFKFISKSGRSICF